MDSFLGRPLVLEHQVPADDQGSAAPSCMTMHCDFLLLGQDVIHGLDDFDESENVSGFVVPPAEVVEVDFLLVELLGEIGEPRLSVNLVPAVGMFSGLLETENGADLLVLELGNEIELLDDFGGRPLHGEDLVSDPVGVEPDEGVEVGVVEVVFVFAGNASAENASDSKALGKSGGFACEKTSS